MSKSTKDPDVKLAKIITYVKKQNRENDWRKEAKSKPMNWKSVVNRKNDEKNAPLKELEGGERIDESL